MSRESDRNWAMGLTSLADILVRYGFAKQRQGHTDKMQLKNEQLRRELAGMSQEGANTRQQARFDRSDRLVAEDRERNLAFPEDAVIPNFTGGPPMANPLAGMTYSEATDDINLRNLLSGGGGEQGGAPEYSYDIGGGQTIEGISPAGRMTQYRHDNPNESAMGLGDYIARQEVLQGKRAETAARNELREDVKRVVGGMYADLRGHRGKGGSIKADRWKPVEGKKNVFKRGKKGGNLFKGEWWDDEEITLAELAAQRFAPLIADGDVDEFDRAAVDLLANDLGIAPMEIVRTWDQGLIQMYLDLEKNPLTDEQDKVMGGM